MDVMPWHTRIFSTIQFIFHCIFPRIWFRFPEIENSLQVIQCERARVKTNLQLLRKEETFVNVLTQTMELVTYMFTRERQSLISKHFTKKKKKKKKTDSKHLIEGIVHRQSMHLKKMLLILIQRRNSSNWSLKNSLS